MVGVPSLVLWPSGPSSRMFWPNSLRRSQRMNMGPMSSIRIIATTLAPMALNIRALLQQGFHGGGDALQAQAARGFDQHGLARLDELRQRRHAVFHGGEPALAGRAREVGAGQLADGHHAHAAFGAQCSPTPRWKASAPGPSSYMSPRWPGGPAGGEATRWSTAAVMASGLAL